MWSRASGTRNYLILFAIPLLMALSCDSSRLISGVYRSTGRVVIDGASGFQDGPFVELMLGQFGPDLTGIVRVFDEDQFMVPPDGLCECRFLDDGSVIGSDVSFAFRSNGECPGSDDTPYIVASLTFEKPGAVIDEDSADVLKGTLVVEGHSRDDAPVIEFRRVRPMSEVGEEDLKCDDPLVRRAASSRLNSSLSSRGVW